ncbi:MAG: tRNA pseudouridine(38-40) synthase TruA [Gammaproteobacteria bacterium]|nr:tRNA pseudouridine(38-40) synthase TruA [Gammaproteobacteria bacterium]
MRIALGVEYDGSRFNGWQYQDHSRSVQEAVEKGLSRVANHLVRVHCAGRTDTGVHATGQVIHFDTDVDRNERAWVFGTNANIPKEVSILWAKPVSDEFHARFKATRRRYRYVIFNREVRPTFLAYRTSWCYRPLDVEPMQQAASYLVGQHDFSSYRAVACQAKSPVREVFKLTVSRQGQLVFIDIEANAFLHHMVRNIAGVLMEIGRGERSPEWSKEVLDYRDRTLAGVTAPPFGLYLTQVTYPQEFGIPATNNLPYY